MLRFKKSLFFQRALYSNVFSCMKDSGKELDDVIIVVASETAKLPTTIDTAEHHIGFSESVHWQL